MEESENKQSAKQRRLAPPWLRASWARPAHVALLWVISTALYIADIVFFPGEGGETVSSVLFLSGTWVFAGLLAGWALGLRAATLGLIAVFCAMSIGFGSLWLAYEFWAALQGETATAWWIVTIPWLLGMILLVWFGYARRSRKRRAAAIALVLVANFLPAAFASSDGLFWRASVEAQALLYPGPSDDEEDAADAMPDIKPDRLWEAQPALLAKAVDPLQPRRARRPNVYAIAVAAGGSQQLFSREARLALKVAEARFGRDYRGGVLLSNGTADLLHRPLATQGNLAAAVRSIGGRIDPARDIAFVYLTAHGSREAWLSTDLPSYQSLTPISSASLAEALAEAGIKRRVVIVSACFSASWTPALANDDTIVITAAAKDRTSFGCDDSRRLTFFGEALLEGPLARGASLRDGFEAARRTVARWEAKDKLTPSRPQAYVGRNMRAFWTEGTVH